ncbi:ketopantoate reductase family protein [Sulfurospirillum arcachonense]|uniref:ketopantoate reductase family protein n=1 Tax=Sulfurospirillum arcachonense TaxID=57666 RepID=UPI00046A4009|nr:2-dehydropantoate 2-reductase [Sulfurospirillum arcachonense]
MHIAIIGAGGVGSYYGARLVSSGMKTTFVARGKHLEAIKKNGLHVNHKDFEFEDFEFEDFVDAYDLQALLLKDPREFDALIVLTKAILTKEIAITLAKWCAKHTPYIISLQNGVENEDILASYIDPKKIIGGLSVKIGAHIIKPGIVHAIGEAQTPLGLWQESEEGKTFLHDFVAILSKSNIPANISEDIRLELWKKLIINNGVNAICALLEKKTGEIMHHKKLSLIVLGLMHETAKAAKVAGVEVSQKDVQDMFELISKFDSIKTSMLVDRENSRELELDEICGVVIKNCELQGLDAPYTRTISTLLEVVYES